MIVKPQSLATERLQQSFDLSIQERDDLLLTLSDQTADPRQQNVPRPEQAGHGYRRRSASIQCRQVKPSGGDGRILRVVSHKTDRTSSSADFFDPTLSSFESPTRNAPLRVRRGEVIQSAGREQSQLI